MHAIFLLTALLVASPASAADREALYADLDAAAVETMTLYNQGQYEAAHATATATWERARSLPKKDPRRLRALNNLGDSLYGVGRYDEAEIVYLSVIDDVPRRADYEQFVQTLMARSNLGATFHARGDYATALAWHEDAWTTMVTSGVFPPERHVVATQYAQTTSAMGDHATTRILREWMVKSLTNDHGPDHPEVAQAKAVLASLLIDLGEYGDALVVLQEARAIAQSAEHVPMVVTIHLELARLYLAQAHVELAATELQAAEQAIVAAYGADSPFLLSVYDRWTEVEAGRGNIDAAIELTARVLALHEASDGPSHPNTAIARSNLALISIDNQRFDGVLELLQRSRADLVAALGEQSIDVAHVDATWARLDIEQGRATAAVQRIGPAIERLQQNNPDDPNLPGTRSALAHALAETGDFAESERQWLLAIAGASTILGPNHPTTAQMHSGYGGLLIETGRLGEAERRHRRALDALEAVYGPHHPEITTPLNNLALTLQQQGRLVESEALFERGLAIGEAAWGADSPQIASELHNLGIVQLSRGDLDAAQLSLERAMAIKIATFGPTHPSIAVTLDKLGAIRMEHRDYPVAEKLARRSLAIREAALGEQHGDVAYSLDHLATVLMWVDRYDEAQQLSERAVALLEATDGPGSARTRTARTHLASIASLRGQHAKALAAYEALLASLPPDTPPAHPERVFLGSEIAVLHFTLGNLDAARSTMNTVIQAVEAEVAEQLVHLTERERIALLRVHREALFASLTVQEGDGGDTQATWAAWLRWKGLVGRSLAATPPSRLQAAAPQTWDAFSQTSTALAEATYAGAEPERLIELSRQREALYRELLEQVGGTPLPPIRTANDVCQVLPEQTGLVDIVRRGRFGEPVYTAFVMAPGCLISRVELGAAEPIDAAIARHRALLTERAPTAKVDRPGATLRKLVWDPLFIAWDEAPPTVFLVTDGPTSTLAFGALPTEQGYLVEQVAFRHLDSAVDLLDERPDPDQGQVVVGGVDYGQGGGRGLACASQFPQLPGTATEATAVSEALGTATLLTGAAATELAVSDALADAGLVHLATHGFFANSECRSGMATRSGAFGVDASGMNPMLLSGVALAGANGSATEGDGIWTAHEISGLDLSGTDLVVLSACETGLGEVESGEGVMGLRRAFAQSGARATIMSLWPVDDDATAQMMDTFYATWTADPARDELAALRAAQLALLERNRAQGEAAPAQWAAFVVAGAPR